MAKTPIPNLDSIVLGEIENHIAQVARGVEVLRKGRLNDKALLLLISHASGQSQTVVKAVLAGMAGIEQHFLKKAAK